MGWGTAAAVLVLASGLATPASGATKRLEPLNQYVVTGGDLAQLGQLGYDLTEGGSARGQGVVATPAEADELRAKGYTVTAPYGEAKTSRAAPPDPFATDPTYGYDVFRPWHLKPAPCPGTCSGAVDGAGQPINLQTWYERERAAHPDIVKKVVYGKSRYGQDLVAYKVSLNAHTLADGAKPVVWYETTQHAREWIATEVGRRLFGHVLAHATDTATDIPKLLRENELWFVPVVNVDGYDWTFQSKNTRLWRKTLADNDGNDVIDGNDGVDPNRNWAEKWRYDQEGAVDVFNDDTYRGPTPQSEPEVAQLDAMFKKLKPKFLLDYHSYGPLILYPEGWQVETESTDTPATKALAGLDDDHPAITRFDPDVSGELYTTNGDVTGHVYQRYGSLAYTVELEGGSGPGVGGTVEGPNAFDPGGFVFQDSETAVEDQFQRNLEFALDLARSAKNPGRPVSHIGNTAPDFEPSAFTVSYGSPQTVEVNANRDLGPVDVHWRVGNGSIQTARTSEFLGGERYDPPGVYYHKLRAAVTGFTAGDQVEVWFSAGAKRSSSFTFTAEKSVAKDVLVMAAEDYSGNSNILGEGPRPGPEFLSYYTTALQDAGISYDVYDVDAHARTAPDPLGVLGHYKAVIWYTGNDLYVREPTQPGATGNSKLMDDEVIAVRDYLNEGGSLLVTGQQALQGVWDQFLYNPLGAPPNPFCKSNNSQGQGSVDDPVGQTTNCIIVSNDFVQYYLGAWTATIAAEEDAVATLPFKGAGGPFGTTAFTLNGGDSADNQLLAQTFVTTSTILPQAEFPQFASTRAIGFDRPPAYDPPEGTKYAYAESSDEGYQRLRRTIDLTGATSGALKFKISHDVETEYDYVFVEAHTVGQDDWTTLPDKNGHTTTSVGASCDIDWDTIHPFLDHYQTNPTAGADCTNTGTTGAWNAATGNSDGFQDWEIDLSAYAGKQVEVSITYAQDFSAAGLGVFLDALQVLKNGAVSESNGFEAGLSPWEAGPPPAGTENDAAWVARESVGFVDGPGIATDDTLLWGFGLEGITTRAERSAALKDAITYLTRSKPATPPVPGPPPATYTDSEEGTVGGTVPATLSLSLEAPAQFGAFTPGTTRTYFASTKANVISTAGDALLSVSDPSAFGTGHLVNGTFVLPEPLQARARNAANTGTAYNNVGSSASPLNLLTWSGPVSNDALTLEFSQLVKSTDPLRTGTYSKAVTFTLSTTNP
ncbi:M14 family zinc carboxypeptidase [Solirubrobacter phytolaccae]|uniref:Zinc carboxypeptidase n=1 Tax=Solirubrobacter phytolaccae TaxID=1404360 RepID=A0A9X3N4Z8_9ACTN|nr:M14 family zinc carboxypeptidase [Solirubrobacter phytolaccae]MDA0179744.1 M14 family zinc carboxypeptidase [Solirubrobacter phytolaccae]